MRRSSGGGVFATVVMLLGVALAGVVVTLALYLAALAAVVALLCWGANRMLRRRERVGAGAAQASTGFGALPEGVFNRRVPVEALPESMRDPAWAHAVEARTGERQRLIDHYLSVTRRYNDIHHRTYGHRDQDLTSQVYELEKLVRATFGALPRRVIDGRFPYGVDPAPPAAEVIHVKRGFSLVTDCRYGHCAEHLIVGVTGLAGDGLGMVDVAKGRILRECSTCAPVTRWSELP